MNVEQTFRVWLLVAALVISAAAGAAGQTQLTPLGDMVVDTSALLMPTASTFGRSINGASFQGESLLTYNGYQYATFYHNGTSGNSEDLYIARRNLAGATWELRDTSRNLDNGDSPAWDAHNVISLGISGDGRLHFAYDMHNNTLRYSNSATGVATNPGSVNWTTLALNAELTGLDAGDPAIGDVTYPQFIPKANGDLIFNYRTGSSGNGNVHIATFDATTGFWGTTHEIINGTTSIFYDDAYGSPSNERNAYLNGIDIDSTGRMHTTWTWREAATGSSNHDIMYAYSDDGGDTWRNNAGTVIGTVGSPITMNSLGIIIVPMDRGNTLMNQQAQAVDADNRVHIAMWHKTDAAAPVTGFTTTPAAYIHYFRDPTSGAWTRTELPTDRAVGSRPDLAYDSDGNIYAAYVSPGPGDGQGVTANYYTEGDLVIATASKATGYTDWTIVHTDTRDFSGEPQIDQTRLTQSGILSLVLQENSDANTSRTGTPLHVLEFNKLAKNIVWAGGIASSWTNGPGNHWDSDGNNTGNAAFTNGNRVTFDNGAAAFTVNIVNPVSPTSTTFNNTVAHSYTVTGAAIAGTTGIAVKGGGTVTLANNANSYTGVTDISSGTLALSGAATISSSPTIRVGASGTLDVTATTTGSMTLNNQTLVIDGDVNGNVVATNNSTVNINSVNSMNGNLTAQSGSLAAGAGKITGSLVATGGTVRVGGAVMPTAVDPVTTVVDNFSTAGLSEYTKTRVLELSSPADTEANVSFADVSGALVASYGGTLSAAEQVVLLRNDTNLDVGETLRVDVSMPATAALQDFGLAVSSTAIPTGTVAGGDIDTRDTFDAAMVSVRPSGNNIRVNKYVTGAAPDTGSGVLTADETTVAGLYITRNSNTQFVVGYTDTSSVDHIATTLNFTSTNVGNAIGFYGDLRAVGGSLGAFDNLRIFENTLVAQGETLTVDGNYAQSAGATLALDIFSPTAHDLLDVAGNLAADGTLSVTLAAGAPTLQADDAFHLLDFASLSGVFDSVVLPALSPGLVWDNSLLLTLGVLQVVTGLNGDYNGDQKVDAADYVAWRNSVGQVGAGLAADGNRDFHVDNNDYTLWRSNFGATPSGSGGTAADSHGVPEPSTFLLAAMLGLIANACPCRFKLNFNAALWQFER